VHLQEVSSLSITSLYSDYQYITRVAHHTANTRRRQGESNVEIARMYTSDEKRTACNMRKHEFGLQCANIRRCSTYKSTGACSQERRVNVGTLHVNVCDQWMSERTSLVDCEVYSAKAWERRRHMEWRDVLSSRPT
jgi:hypothetical protein